MISKNSIVMIEYKEKEKKKKSSSENAFAEKRNALSKTWIHERKEGLIRSGHVSS